MRHSNKERDNVAESRPGSNTADMIGVGTLVEDCKFSNDGCNELSDIAKA